MSDLHVENHGSIVLLFADSEEGRAWLDENVYAERWQWVGDGIACEPRMVEAVLVGAAADGLEIAG